MNDTEKRRLVDLWNKNRNCSLSEENELCILVLKLLLGPLYSVIRYKDKNTGKVTFSYINLLLESLYKTVPCSREDLVNDFYVTKVLQSERRGISHTRVVVLYFHRLLIDKVRLKSTRQQEETTKFGSFDEITHELPNCNPGNKEIALPVLKDSDAASDMLEERAKEEWCWYDDDIERIVETLDSNQLTITAVEKKALTFLETLKNDGNKWALLFLRLHDCCPKDNEEHIVRSKFNGRFPSYHSRAGKLGVTIKCTFKESNEVFFQYWGKTMIGSWLKNDIGIELKKENFWLILACLKILCKGTLDRVDEEGNLK